MNQENFNANKKGSSDDEIDISKLFNSIINGFTILFKGILRIIFLFIDTVLTNIKLVIILSLVGAGVGVATYFYTKPFYESNMTLGSSYYRGQLIKNSIENL